MTGQTHRTPEPPPQDYIAICTAETACTYQAISDNGDEAREMLSAHYVIDHHAGDWNKPLQGRR